MSRGAGCISNSCDADATCNTRVRRITPMSGSEQHEMVEIRPGRRLCVFHRNPRARDQAFDIQYEDYLQRVQKKQEFRKDILSQLRLKQQKLQAEKSANSYGYSNQALTLDDEKPSSNSHIITESERNLINKSALHKNGVRRSFSDCGSMLSLVTNSNSNLLTTSPTDVIKDSTILDIPGIIPDSPAKVLGSLGPVESPENKSLRKGSQIDVNTLKNVNLNMYNTVQFESGRTESISSNTIRAGSDQAVVFLLHGVGGSAAVWKAQDEYLTNKNYELVIPDLIGHGFSSTPNNKSAYEFKEITADVLALFDRYCKKRNVIIGHSYGCSFAAKLCRQRSKWINKLILISGGSPTPLAPQCGIFSMPVCFLCCCQLVLSRGFKKSAFYSKKSYIPQEEAFDVPVNVLKYTMNGQMWPEGGVEFHMGLNVPTLIIHGEHDKLVSLEEEQEMKQVIYGSELVVVNEASHMVMLEQPDFVNELIDRFLQKIAPPQGSTTDHLAQEGVDVRTLQRLQASPQKVASPHQTPRRALSARFRRSSRPAVSTLNGSQVSLRSVKAIPSNLVTANLS